MKKGQCHHQGKETQKLSEENNYALRQEEIKRKEVK